jgi:uncharacterized protein YndB with AHSA1/START domain
VVTFEKSIAIKVPPEQVFEYFVEPTHLPEIWPSLVEVKQIEKLPAGGYRYHWLYKMAGQKFEGETKTVEIVPNEKIVEEARGGLESTFQWLFKPENGGTKMTVRAEYELPRSLLARLKEPFVRKLNEHEAETVLVNLKERLEIV